MSTTPIEGVSYWWDSVTQTFIAPGRPSLTVTEVVAGIRYGALDTTNYAVPAGALFVSPSGSDTAAGTLAAPYKTLKRATAVAPAGSTIVMRAGSYFEGSTEADGLGNGFTTTNDGLTIQSYPGEKVWLDGSEVLAGWATYDTNKWRAPLALTLDRAPTQVRGETLSSWGSFVMQEYPIAHWPEMVLVNGVQLQQVQTLAEVGPGKFFVQGTSPNATGTHRNFFTSTHYVIGDNPSGKEVRVGKLSRAGQNNRSDLTVRGIGFRRYANTMPDWGCLYNSGARVTLEECIFEDMSDYGFNSSFANAPATVRHCTFRRMGRKGMGANGDGSLIEWCHFEETNNRRFNYGPDGGAIKVGRCWDLTVRYNRFIDNYGHGVWFDESCLRGVTHGNYFNNTHGTSFLYEIGAAGLCVDNIIIDNGIGSTDVASNRRPHFDQGIKILGSDKVKVWHNTIINPEVGMQISEGWRKPFGEGSFGRDPRQPDSFYQTVMTWDVRQGDVCNNAFIGTAGLTTIQSCFASFYDENNVKGTLDFGMNFAGNLYSRVDNLHPQRFVMGWAAGGGGTTVYFNMTGNPYNDTAPWKTAMNDPGSALLEAVDAVQNKATGQIKSSAMSAVAPATPPADVQALLDKTIFNPQRVGAGYLKEV